jgi:hypothetical protein
MDKHELKEGHSAAQSRIKQPCEQYVNAGVNTHAHIAAA